METNTSKVIVEDVKGAEELTDHLIEQGCKRIAVIAGSKNLLISRKRLQGYQHSLKKHGLVFNEELVAYTDFTNQSAVTAVDKWLLLNEKPDAIFSMSDKCAVATIMHLKQRKIKIPGEMCVAGFGNDPMGEVIEPGLT